MPGRGRLGYLDFSHVQAEFTNGGGGIAYSCSKMAERWPVSDNGLVCQNNNSLGEGAEKIKVKKKLTSVSFMYVCAAENAELLVFFYFFPLAIV